MVGIAASGGICRSKDVASVVRENGLQTAYLVAHEIAHKYVRAIYDYKMSPRVIPYKTDAGG